MKNKVFLISLISRRLNRKINNKKPIGLVAVVILALGLRLFGLNWDQGFHLHPDERMIVMVTEKLGLPPEKSLNPKFFAYGSFPLYFLKFISWLVSLAAGKQWATYQYLPILGRIISSLFDLGTVILIFKIGKKLFNEKIAFLSALLYSTCVLPIQLSHFYAVDVILNFFIWLTLWRLILFYQEPVLISALLVGASFGLALATKISATVLLAAIGFALVADFVLIGLKLWRSQRGSWWWRLSLLIKRTNNKKLFKIIARRLFGLGGVVTASTVLVFLICEPYALLDFATFWQQISEQHQMVKSAYVFPYTLQYVGTTPYFYQVKNMILWGMGLSLGLVSTIGAIGYLINLIRRLKAEGDYDQEALELIVVVFALAYFFVVGRFAVKFMRYFLPLYPFFILVGSSMLVYLFEEIKKFRIIIALLLFGHFAWTLAFESIYLQPNTRVQASRWINENVPSGSILAVEHWDDRLPLWGGERYRFLQMPMYDNDFSLAKWERVKSNLALADYIILASNRLYVPLQKLSDCSQHKVCYPKTAKYYQDLFSGQLGFKKVAEFTSYPLVNDDLADESFTVYDHPKIIIFQRARPLFAN